MGDPRISYIPREDATVQGEIAALATVYAYILECHERKKGSRPDDEREGARSSSSQERYPMAGHDD